MDKSVNNFDDVDDTMSSVYNAWRKLKTALGFGCISAIRKIHTSNHHHLSPSLFLTLSFFTIFFGVFFFRWLLSRGFLVGTYLILITLNNENFWSFLFFFFHLELSELEIKKYVNHKDTQKKKRKPFALEQHHKFPIT